MVWAHQTHGLKTRQCRRPQSIICSVVAPCGNLLISNCQFNCPGCRIFRCTTIGPGGVNGPLSTSENERSNAKCGLRHGVSLHASSTEAEWLQEIPRSRPKQPHQGDRYQSRSFPVSQSCPAHHLAGVVYECCGKGYRSSTLACPARHQIS